ncbi:hypothetical protein A1O1_00425 [Capronia coronata CBS 617.96]|uniref:Copper-fist domain-containing protein n=1 Tax=Capronia coronata CBS 617.96 TaxID=1182541 RepID=W9Z028_9EURO|nr:uncharacterized protein A1O1_00425 [Capronia coronata CBS 617.96]EXJ95305.1 hypothetical protein A1O1_00425 [Capronia coronata CBS 617.96]
MLINGEKFACEACVRGHRVSSCHHQDRPLVHVNKKGRPVSQCQHCRGLRKARSQHVKCECHDKAHPKDECPHVKTENKAEPHTCCCTHGQRCTCSLKKDLDSVPEDIPPLIQPKEHAKQRPNMNSHESKTTIFTNGHHKPVHKFNDAHNQLGAPYKIPSRSHSLHGHRDLAHRSTDSLPLLKTSRPFHESPLHNSMTDAVDIMQRRVKSEHNSPALGPTNGMVDPAIQDLAIPSFDPKAYSYSPFGTDTPPTQTNGLQNGQTPGQQDLSLPERFPESWFMTYEQAHEYEPPPGSRYTDFTAVDWSTFNLDTNPTPYNSSQSNSPYLAQQAPYPQIDLSNQMNNAGITSSSGEVSEVDDQSPPSHLAVNNRPLNNVERSSGLDGYSDFNSIGGDDVSDRHRLSSASSYYGTPQANLLAADNLGTLDIDEYIKQAEAETKRMQMQQQMAQMQMSPQDVQSSRMSSVSRAMTPTISTPGSTANGEHPFTIREAQRYAHMDGGMSNQISVGNTNSSSSNNSSNSNNHHAGGGAVIPPAVTMTDDPAWSVAPDMSNPELSLDDEQEDEDWVR